jgi:hypothetical protein
LKGKRTSGEDLPGLSVAGVRHTEKDPEAVRTARGERRKPTPRYPVSTTNL